ncbi:LysR family transcriptional regulator [Sphingobium sp. LMC3-1-1.1]|uniref:LysR family transcriptional regulator n=1 Tax=unclassified Sphingobium TaxID=2611147 RepID=UPI0010E8DC48
MHINLNFLQTFISVAEHESFRRAAEEMGRTQSAISMQIRQLEDQIGARLFNRSTRRVELTMEGERLLRFARRSLADLNFGLRSLKEELKMRKGFVSFGCIPTLSSSLLPHLIYSFEQEFPGITMSVRESSMQDLLEKLRSKEIEMGIGLNVEGAVDFVFEPFLQEEIMAFIPPPFQNRSATSITLAELAELPAIVLDSATALRGVLDAELAARGLKLRTRYEVSQVQTQYAMAVEGIGVAIMPACAIPRGNRENLQILPIVDPRLSRTICIITPRGTVLREAARAFADFTKSMLSAQSARPAPPA